MPSASTLEIIAHRAGGEVRRHLHLPPERRFVRMSEARLAPEGRRDARLATRGS